MVGLPDFLLAPGGGFLFKQTLSNDQFSCNIPRSQSPTGNALSKAPPSKFTPEPHEEHFQRLWLETRF